MRYRRQTDAAADENKTQELPPETTVEIPGNEARAFKVCQGQLLSIADLFGHQPATLFAFVKDDLLEFLSPTTRVCSVIVFS